MLNIRTASAVIVMLVAGLSPAPAQQSDAEKQLVVKLMQETKIVAVTNIATADGFVEDKDPNTLEVVFLTAPNAGKSHVSDDGEVIFLNNASDDEMQALTIKAFEIRAKLRLGKE